MSPVLLTNLQRRAAHGELVLVCGPAAGAHPEFPLGRAAALRCAGIDVVVTSERDQARRSDLFTNLGIEPALKRLVVVKSSQHFYESFAKIAGHIVYVNCPGSLQRDLRTYEYKHVMRPRWPLDPAPAAPWRVAIHSRDT